MHRKVIRLQIHLKILFEKQCDKISISIYQEYDLIIIKYQNFFSVFYLIILIYKCVIIVFLLKL